MARDWKSFWRSADTKNDHTDIAAVLVAVLVVAFGPLSTAGPWSWMNSVIALVVFFVLAVYSWPDFLRNAPIRCIALGLVFWATVTVGLAWPVQRFVLDYHPRSDRAWIEEFDRCKPSCDASEVQARALADDVDASNYATGWAALAAVGTIYMSWALTRKCIKPIELMESNQQNPDPRADWIFQTTRPRAALASTPTSSPPSNKSSRAVFATGALVGAFMLGRLSVQRNPTRP